MCWVAQSHHFFSPSGQSLFEFTVESYDPTVNAWIQETSIPVDRISEVEKCSFEGCVLKLSKGVLDQLD